MNPITNRYDFILLFDVTDGNPNGDPDSDNMPRVDDNTRHGLVTDVCIKRKIRNYISLLKEYQPPYDMYVKEAAVLDDVHKRAYEALEDPDGNNAMQQAQAWICQHFFDVRTFGAVLSVGAKDCGKVKGPVQLTFARSINPVNTKDHTITRMAITNEELAKKKSKNQTMGNKKTIAYGLYLMKGHISANFAAKSGFSDADLELLWQAIINMFEDDRSSARGEMAVRGLYAFKHDDKMGNAPAHKLFELVNVSKKEAVETPMQFADYNVSVDEPKGFKGISLLRLVE